MLKDDIEIDNIEIRH